MSHPIRPPQGGAPFVGGVAMGGVDLHLHGPDRTTLTGGYLKAHDGSTASPRFLNGYEAAMADLYAQNLGLKRY